MRRGRDRDDKDDDDHKDDHKGELILRVNSAGELSVWKDGFKRLRGLVATEGAIYAVTKRHRDVRERKRRRRGIYKIPIEADGSAGEVSLYAGGIKEGEGLAQDYLGAFYVSAEKIAGEQKKKGKKKKKEVIAKVSSDGTVTPFAWGLEDRRGLAIDSTGDLYVAVEKLSKDSHHSHKHRNRKKRGGILHFRAPPPPAVEVPLYTNENPLVISGTTEPDSQINIFPNDFDNPTSLFTEDGSFSFDWELTRNAENFATIWSTDHHGLGLTGPRVEIKTIHDDIVSTIVFLQPPAGRPVRGTVNIEARASDNGSGVGNFEIRAAGQLLGSVLSPPPPSGSVNATAPWNTKTVPDGTYAINASAVDQAGNSRTVTRLLLVDNTPPETLISVGPEGTVSGSSFTFSVTGTDNLAQPQELQFAWRLDGGPFSAFSPQTEISFNNLSPGDHVFEVKAIDPAGNEDPTLASRTFTVSLLSVQITEPGDGATVPEGSLLVRGTVDGGDAEVGVSVNGFLAAVQGNAFAALVPVTQETTTLTAVAAAAGNSATQTIGISVLPAVIAPVALLPSPESGVAPLTVGFSLLGGPTPVSIDLDFDGDDTVDFNGASLEGETFTYTQPGIFIPTVTVRDAQGNQTTAQAVIRVYDQASLDGILQAKWTGMKDALRSGDIATGLTFIVGRSRPRYEEAFRIIESSLPSINAILTDVTLIKIREGSAIYEASRIDDGLPKSFELRFALDEDGIWRIEAF